MNESISTIDDAVNTNTNKNASLTTTTNTTPATNIPTQQQRQRNVIVVLENASLEVAKLHPHNSKLQLLNCDEHQSILKRLGRDIADARPDIVHQCLLTLLDSPLNKSGHLEVYIHTAQKVVIRINPECRIPRTIKRFSGLMIQLLERGFIAGQGRKQQRLLEIVQGPITHHLPDNAIKLALSWNAPKVRLYDHFNTLDLDQRPLVIAVGAMAKGEDTFADAYTNEKIGKSKGLGSRIIHYPRTWRAEKYAVH